MNKKLKATRKIMKRTIHTIVMPVLIALLAGCASTTPTSRTQESAQTDYFHSAHPQFYKLLAKVPAQNGVQRDSVNAALLELGPGGITRIAGMILPSGIGDDSKARFALGELTNYVAKIGAGADKTMLESVFLNSLQSADDWEVKAFFIRQLETVGGAASVPVLGKYLQDEKLADPAIKALVAIDRPEAAPLVLSALRSTSGGETVRYINALGALRAQAAAPDLRSLAGSQNQAVQLAALNALARIGDPAARDLYVQAMQTDDPYRRSQIIAAYLSLGERLTDTGNSDSAVQIFRNVLDSDVGSEQANVRSRALAGLVHLEGAEANDALLDAINDQNKQVRMAALALARDLPGQVITARWTGKLSSVDPVRQMEILHMLGGRGDAGALPAVLSQLNSSDQGVRIAAVKSAVRLDGGEVASRLISRLGETNSSEETEVIRTALLQIPNQALLPAVKNGLELAPSSAQTVLLDMLAERRAGDYKETVFQYTRQGPAEVRTAAISALGSVASPQDLSQVISLMLNAGSNAQRTAAQRAAVQIAGGMPETDQVAPFTSAFGSASSQGKVALLQAIGQLKSQSALQVLTDNARNSDSRVADAAIRALSDWQTPDGIPALVDIVKGNNSLSHKVLAIRGAIRLLPQADLPMDEKVQRYQTLMSLAPRPQEKRMVLGGLANLNSAEALHAVVGYLDDPDLQSDAAMAVVNYAGRVPDDRGKMVASLISQDVLTRVVDERTATRIRNIVQQRTMNQPPEGFEALFNGEDLSGWQGIIDDGNPVKKRQMSHMGLIKARVKADSLMREQWHVNNGILSYDGGGYHSLRTIKEYHNFEMYVDWKIQPGGDSGIYLRGVPQVQIWDVNENPVGSGGLYNNKNHPSDPLVVADNPPGEWNTFHIKMVDDRVTVWLNGQLVVDNVVLENYWERDKPVYQEGPIWLQAHNSHLEFRNIYIRELPGKKQLYSGPLFNGKDLSGWEVVGADNNTWHVEDGILYTEGEGGGWLSTDRMYSNFKLSLEFRVPAGGNSGVFLRAPHRGDPAYTGMEIQVLDDYAEQYNNLEPWQYCGSIYKVQAPTKRVTKPAGEWNKYEILCDGPIVKIWLNGVLINDANLIQHMDKTDTHPGIKRRAGYIGLQNHSTRIDYRNIHLTELE